MERAFASLSTADHVFVVRSFGRGGGFRRMTCGLLERLLPSLDSCLLALTDRDPDIPAYMENLGHWADRVLWGVQGAERQVAFLDRITPRGRKVMILDDNITRVYCDGEPLTGALETLTREGFEHMERAGAKVWSVCDNPNPRQWCDAVDVGNGLIYGAAFGLVATHEETRDSCFGQILDDVERSCRFHDHDGATVRLGRFQVYKRDIPGMYRKRKGGISATLTKEAYSQQRITARAALLSEFPHLLEPADTLLGIRFKQEPGRTRPPAFVL